MKMRAEQNSALIFIILSTTLLDSKFTCQTDIR